MKTYFESLSDVINFVEENQEPIIKEVGGYEYSNKPMHLVSRPTAERIVVHSLAAIAEYVKEQADSKDLFAGKFIINIVNPKEVTLLTELDSQTRKREKLLKANAYDCAPEFSRWLDLESFIIQLRSRFVQNEDTEAILSALGNIKKDEGVSITDDGFSQNVTTKKGIEFENKTLPNPARLKPFRTFADVSQPESEYVLRVSDRLEVRLDEADGGVWRIAATENIKQYFEEHLAEAIAIGQVVILG